MKIVFQGKPEKKKPGQSARRWPKDPGNLMRTTWAHGELQFASVRNANRKPKFKDHGRNHSSISALQLRIINHRCLFVSTSLTKYKLYYSIFAILLVQGDSIFH